MPPPSDADLGGGADGEPGGVLGTVTRSTWLGRGFRVKGARARVRVIGLGVGPDLEPWSGVKYIGEEGESGTVTVPLLTV